MAQSQRLHVQVMLNLMGDTVPTELEKKHPRSEPGPRLLVWGGKGRHQAIFDDLYELDLIKVRLVHDSSTRLRTCGPKLGMKSFAAAFVSSNSLKAVTFEFVCPFQACWQSDDPSSVVIQRETCSLQFNPLKATSSE